MVHKNVMPVCSPDEFRCHLAQSLEEASGFRIPFALKEHHSFAQLLPARAGGHECVLPDEQQRDTGTCLTASACALAFGFLTDRWTSAIRAAAAAFKPCANGSIFSTRITLMTLSCRVHPLSSRYQRKGTGEPFLSSSTATNRQRRESSEPIQGDADRCLGDRSSAVSVEQR